MTIFQLHLQTQNRILLKNLIIIIQFICISSDLEYSYLKYLDTCTYMRIQNGSNKLFIKVKDNNKTHTPEEI